MNYDKKRLVAFGVIAYIWLAFCAIGGMIIGKKGSNWIMHK